MRQGGNGAALMQSSDRMSAPLAPFLHFHFLAHYIIYELISEGATSYSDVVA